MTEENEYGYTPQEWDELPEDFKQKLQEAPVAANRTNELGVTEEDVPESPEEGE